MRMRGLKSRSCDRSGHVSRWVYLALWTAVLHVVFTGSLGGAVLLTHGHGHHGAHWHFATDSSAAERLLAASHAHEHDDHSHDSEPRSLPTDPHDQQDLITIPDVDQRVSRPQLLPSLVHSPLPVSLARNLFFVVPLRSHVEMACASRSSQRQPVESCRAMSRLIALDGSLLL
jgi:hypothetical protein